MTMTYHRTTGYTQTTWYVFVSCNLSPWQRSTVHFIKDIVCDNKEYKCGFLPDELGPMDIWWSGVDNIL